MEQEKEGKGELAWGKSEAERVRGRLDGGGEW